MKIITMRYFYFFTFDIQHNFTTTAITKSRAWQFCTNICIFWYIPSYSHTLVIPGSSETPVVM